MFEGLLERLRDRYIHEDILILRKVRVFFVVLIAMIITVVLYCAFLLVSRSPYMGDLKFILILLVLFLVSVCLFARGRFEEAVMLTGISLIIPLSLLIYNRETLNELNLYNMAFLHSLGIIFMVLLANRSRNIIITGLLSVVCLTGFLFMRLLPQAESVMPYLTTFLISLLVISLETLIGIQIHRLLFRSLRELQYKASHDDSTGLLNKNSMLDALGKIPSRVENTALIFYRIENYSELMLNLGEETILSLTDEVALILDQEHRVKVYLVTPDTLGLFLTDPVFTPASEVNRILYRFSIPIVVENLAIQVMIRSSRLELTSLPDDKQQLINRGLLGLYKATTEKKRHVILEENDEKKIRENLSIVHELSDALQEDRCYPSYQSVHDGEGHIIAFEALTRWAREDGSPVSPSVFIPFLETSGMMADFFLRMLRNILADMKKYEIFQGDRQVFINLSPELINFGFNIDKMLEIVDAVDMDHRKIGFEITEATIAEDQQVCIELIERLRAESFTVALDDFGTGYSNLSQILQLPIQKIKFDKSFIDDILTNPKKSELCQLLITYFDKYNYLVVAEGVEDKAQFDLLNSMGQVQYQGYLFSKAQRAENLREKG